MTHGSLGSFAMVQPHEGCTCVIVTGALEVFVAVNVNSAFSSPGFGVTSFCTASHTNGSGWGCAAMTAGAATCARAFAPKQHASNHNVIVPIPAIPPTTRRDFSILI
jgi:hypothetical protein